ncbi:MARVEL domain-containing protein 3 isoform X3 [Lemur catta]|uniref:MARVEL domain-containing protein 3 isoform X3 n=1 Tax=Lemur catta TaxID=9447 RepID=UPI001E26DA6A|nr:MARVEL domain-containing protein 3 isoform X3 [Lemur catta]
MEDTSGTREPRARPRERDADRRAHADRERRPERPRDRPRDPHRERNRDGRGNANRREDRDRERDRDPRQDRRRDAGHRAGEQRVWEESRQSRTRDAPRGRTWDAAPQPRPAPGAAREPPPLWKEDLGRHRPESEPTSGRYLSSNPRSGLEEVEFYQSEAEGLLECHKCKYLCTGRDGEKAQRLDVQFYQLKLPTVTGAMAYSGALMAFSCLLVVTGVLRVPWHCPLWLVIEALLDVLIAGGYIPALYFYFQYLSDAYSSPVCTEREALYQSKGYSGFSCSFHGGDIGAGIFAALGIGVFALGAVLAIKGYRKVRKLKKKPAEMFTF